MFVLPVTVCGYILCNEQENIAGSSLGYVHGILVLHQDAVKNVFSCNTAHQIKAWSFVSGIASVLPELWWFFSRTVILTLLSRAVMCLFYIDEEINRLGNLFKLTKVSVVQLRPSSALTHAWFTALGLSSYMYLHPLRTLISALQCP